MKIEKINETEIELIKKLLIEIKSNHENINQINDKDEWQKINIEYTFLYKFFSLLKENSSEVIRCCTHTFENHFTLIIKNCEEIINRKKTVLNDDLIIQSLYLFYELYLIKKSANDIHIVNEAWGSASAILYNYEDLFSSIKYHTQIIKNELPFLILKSNPISEDQKKFQAQLDGTESRLISNEKRLIKKQEDVENKIILIDEYDKKINNILSGYNFVGLFKGFSDMHEEIALEKSKNIKNMKKLGFGVISIATALAIISALLTLYDTAIEFKLMTLLPILGVEFLVVYFFRLSYIEYRSITSQILQVKLRMTLCQFIQSYAEYAKKLEGQSLEKFENIIFSGIVPDPQNIPSTYDGFDQIGQLFSRIKS